MNYEVKTALLFKRGQEWEGGEPEFGGVEIDSVVYVDGGEGFSF